MKYKKKLYSRVDITSSHITSPLLLFWWVQVNYQELLTTTLFICEMRIVSPPPSKELFR